MTAADLATAGFIDEWMRAVMARLDRLGSPAAGDAPPAVVLYSVQGLAEVLSCDPSTVRRWLREGKQVKDQKGREQTVKLQAYYFSADARIPWPALLAYERGEHFDLAALPAPAAPPPKNALAKPDTTPVLRLAS